MSLISEWCSRIKRTKRGNDTLRRVPFWYTPALRAFERLSRAPLEARRAFSEKRLERVLAAARRTPYGRRVGGGRRIEDWPLLEKDQVRACPYDFLACPSWRTVPASTSGTTGAPLKLFRSYSSVSAEQAALDWLYRTLGYDPTSLRLAVLRGDYIKSPSDLTPPFWRSDAAGARLVLSTDHLSLATIEAYHRVLLEFAPDCLFTYPSALEQLCRLLRQHSLRLTVPLVVCSSEMLTTATRRLAEGVLGAELVDYYGLAERVAFAYSFGNGGYHFLPGYAWIELIPLYRKPEGAVYEIVGTSLWNYAMPLVRYRTGDCILLPHNMSENQLDAIRFGVSVFQEVMGRAGDALLTPDGRVLTAMDYIPRDVECVVRMQVVQERVDLVRVLVVADEGFGDSQRQQILTNARRKIPESIHIEVEQVDALEQGAQMKTPFFITKVDRLSRSR